MIRPFLKLLPMSVLAVLMTGCGLGTNSSVTSPVAPAAATASGIVMGGQQPVGGITLQLYTVGTSGYGSTAAALGSTFQTTPAGNFNLPAFTCPSPSSLTYLVGTGGQPIPATQTTPGVTNPNLSLMVGLGACSAVGSTFINMNEVTTVATIWSLSGFMTGITSIGAPATNALGIQNAFAAINKVTNTTNGQVSGPLLPASAVLPIAEIDTLADIMEQCVNSAGGAASDTTDGQTNGTGCGKLFYLATTSSSTPTDTITAALNIAQHPAQNVAKLNALRSSAPAFLPAINVNMPPSDWTIAITYSGGGLSGPRGVATDQSGNVWVANPSNSSVSKFASSGAALSGTSGFTAGNINVPYVLAIDQSGSVWVANSGNNSLTKMTSLGTSGTAYIGNGLSTPKGVALDGSGNVLVSNTGNNSFSGFTNAGAQMAGSPFTNAALSSPVAIAVSPR